MAQPRSDALRSDALALQQALTDLVRAYQFRDREAICCYDVSLGQSHALERLVREGPMTMSEIAAALFLEKSSASRLVDGLVKKGYVVRRSDPDDGRSVRIEVSKRGRMLAERLEEDLVAERTALLADFSEQERQTIVAALGQLARAVSDPEQVACRPVGAGARVGAEVEGGPEVLGRPVEVGL